MENAKLIEDESELLEEESELVPVIRVVPDPLGRRALNFFTGLPLLIPAIKRRRERKHWVRYLERRRKLWRKAKTEAEVPFAVRKTGVDQEDWEVDEDSKYYIESEIKYVETKCNADLSRVKARIDAIDLCKLAKQADKYGIPVPDVMIIDETNGEKSSPSTWVEFLDRCEVELTNKEKIKLRLDVQAKRDERRKQRIDALVPVLTVMGQVLTAGAAVVSALVALAALKK